MRKLLELKNKHLGETCLLLGAGPSLSEFNSEMAEGKIVIAIKQALLKYPNAHYHFINDNNLIHYKWQNGTTVFASHATNVNVPFLRVIADYVFLIEQNKDFNNSLSHDLDFEEQTIEKRPLVRKFGPGLIWEHILFFCYHIGIKEIYSLGVDLALKGEKTRSHFYNDTVINKAHTLGEDEANSEIELSGHFYRWLKKQSVVWYKLSQKENYLHGEIPIYI